MECSTFKEDAHSREAQSPHGDNCRNQNAEHAREAFPDFAVELREVAFLDETCHVGVARDADRETEDGDERVHDAVSVVEARNAACAKVCAKASDDKFKAKHGTHAKRHREHHLEVTDNVGMLGFANKFIMDAAALGAKNLEGKESDECADRYAPGKSSETVIVAGVVAEPKACGTAAHNRDIVNETRERWNQELLASVLDSDENATDEDEDLPRQDNATIVSGTFQKFRGHAIDSQQRDEFLHPDERRNHENQEYKPERVKHVAEEFPAATLVTSDFVARKNRDKYDGEKSGAHDVIQNVRNHERKIKSVFFERHAGGVGKEHFTENPENTAQEHRNGNNNSGFIHVGCKI